MHHRSLGNTGIVVPILGIGSSPFRHGTHAANAALLERAIDLGVTYYDTARSYLNGEEAVAHLRADLREKLTVATKTGARGGRRCLQDLQDSLNTMRVKSIDIWMTHMVRDHQELKLCTDLGGFCDIATAAKQAGLVRASGASFHAPTDVILRAIEDRIFDVVMFQVNLIGRETVVGASIRSYVEYLLPAAAANNVGVVVMKVLAGGELKHGAPGLGFTTDAASQRDTVGGAIRFVAANPDIATAVVGMASVSELERNVAAVEGVDDSMRGLFEAWQCRSIELGAGECTRCGACLDACPEQIEIPKVMRLYDQYRFFEMRGVARYKYSQIDVPAASCMQCRRCQEVCPEPIDIAAALSEAHMKLAGPIATRPAGVEP